MAKISRINKVQILRWIAVFPVSVIAILLYNKLSGWLSEVLFINFLGNQDSTFMTYINCFFIPSIVLMSGYFISPKFKFNSTLILSLFYILITIYALATETYLQRGLSPFIIIFMGTYLAGLYLIYKLNNKEGK
jgi:hypothetical protein